jgi:hypothetical protein
MDILTIITAAVLSCMGLMVLIICASVVAYRGHKIWDIMLYGTMVFTILLVAAGWIVKACGLSC